jgi:hypothetical protein
MELSEKPAEAGGKLATCSSFYLLLLLASCLNYSSTLKMDVVYSSETSGCHQTMWHHNPEDHSLQMKTNS